MKDNFLLNIKIKPQVDSLTDEEAGILFKGILNYASTGESNLKGLMYSIFIPIKEDIDKNNEKYKKKKEIMISNRNLQEISQTSSNDEQEISCVTRHNTYNTIHNTLYIKQIIEYLNNKLNTNYKYNSKNTMKHINARLNEGYVLDDFIAVIDKKYAEWFGTDMQQYLRPETLFGSKFEGYVNQEVRVTTENIKLSEQDIEEIFG